MGARRICPARQGMTVGRQRKPPEFPTSRFMKLGLERVAAAAGAVSIEGEGVLLFISLLHNGIARRHETLFLIRYGRLRSF